MDRTLLNKAMILDCTSELQPASCHIMQGCNAHTEAHASSRRTGYDPAMSTIFAAGLLVQRNRSQARENAMTANLTDNGGQQHARLEPQHPHPLRQSGRRRRCGPTHATALLARVWSLPPLPRLPELGRMTNPDHSETNAAGQHTASDFVLPNTLERPSCGWGI